MELSVNEKIQARIHTKGIKAEDIYHPNRLSVEQIQDIDLDRVYEWIRTGAWKRKHFNIWLKSIRVI